MKILTVIFLILLALGCGDKSLINKDFNRENKELIVQISTVTSEKEMKHRVWKYEKGIQG